MPTPRAGNRRYLLRLWIPVLLFAAFLAIIVIAALTSGDPDRMMPVAVGLPVAAVMIVLSRWHAKNKIARMLRAADPAPSLRSFARAVRRVPHGSLFAAANSATILALYGRFEDAEHALGSVSWEGVPPLVQAQESAARAVLAYARGSLADGLDYSVAGTQQALVDPATPGAATSELAFRTYRNLGLALSGRATDTTVAELRVALTQLPSVGQLLAAWGLAAIAKKNGRAGELQEMRALIEQRAPHFKPVLESIG